MITSRVSESEKRVYVNVNGYITKKDAREFLANYKNSTKGMKLSQYNLVVTPSVFECEDNEDIRTTCMAFVKSGYKRIYLVDEKKSLMSAMSLKPMEKKIFLKSVKIVSNINLIK